MWAGFVTLAIGWHVVIFSSFGAKVHIRVLSLLCMDRWLQGALVALSWSCSSVVLVDAIDASSMVYGIVGSVRVVLQWGGIDRWSSCA